MQIVFAIITSLKCGHCKKFRGNGKIGREGSGVSIYGNRGRGWRWDLNFFISIFSSFSSPEDEVLIYDIVFLDMAPKSFYEINKYCARDDKIFKEEINDDNIIGNIPPPSVLENYIEKYPCFLFVNGNIWNYFSSSESWKEFEPLFSSEESLTRSKYVGSPMYAVAPVTNSTPTVLKGYGPKGIFSFGYLERYNDDFRITQQIDIVDEFRKFSKLSQSEQSFPSHESQSQLQIRVPSYKSSAITEWTSVKPFFIDSTSQFDDLTFMYLPCEHRIR